jgi:hypothetical protein
MIHDRRLASALGRRAVALAVACAALAAPGAPRAQTAQVEEAFTVRNVAVDATAENAAAARERALAEGQREAYRRLIARLVPADRHAALPRLGQPAIADLVHNFEVDSEKTSPVRYLARLTVRFKPGAVAELVRRAHVPYAETASRPVLVIPLYRAGGALLLWDDPNPWRTAWSAAVEPTADGLVPMIAPKGDLADIRDLGPEQALRRDGERLRAIARRYGAPDILLAYAVLRLDAQQNVPVVDVTATRVAESGAEQTVVYGFTGTAERPVEALLAEAAAAVRQGIEEAWKRDNLLRLDEQRRLVIAVPLTGLADWVEVRRRLAGVATIRRSALKSLTRETAILDLDYFGDEEQLAGALAQRDLELTQGEGEENWTITLRRPESMAPAAGR